MHLWCVQKINFNGFFLYTPQLTLKYKKVLELEQLSDIFLFIYKFSSSENNNHTKH